jgi:HEAT repeat protein
MRTGMEIAGGIRGLRRGRILAVLRGGLSVFIALAWGEAVLGAAPAPAATATAPLRKPDLRELAALALESKETADRMQALRSLARTKDPRALAPILAGLKDERMPVRWSAVEALGELENTEAVPQLLRLLHQEEAYRWNLRLVVNALGNLRDPRAVPPLLELLKDEDEFLRKTTLFALKKIGDPKAFLPMVAMLRDPEPWVRRTAQRLLVEWTEGLHAASPPRDPDGWTRWFEQTGFPPPGLRGTRRVGR